MGSSRLRDSISIVLTVVLALFLLYVFQPSMLPLARLSELRAALPTPDAVSTPDAPPTGPTAAPSAVATAAATASPTPRPAATATVTATALPLSRVGLTPVDTPAPTTTTPLPTPAGTATTPTATAAASVTGAPTPWTGAYVVQNGDTLSEIAARFGVTMAQLAAENNISDVNTLNVGKTLKVPRQ